MSNLDDIYKAKYLKYKTKYTQLKEQEAGGLFDGPIIKGNELHLLFFNFEEFKSTLLAQNMHPIFDRLKIHYKSDTGNIWEKLFRVPIEAHIKAELLLDPEQKADDHKEIEDNPLHYKYNQIRLGITKDPLDLTILAAIRPYYESLLGLVSMYDYKSLLQNQATQIIEWTDAGKCKAQLIAALTIIKQIIDTLKEHKKYLEIHPDKKESIPLYTYDKSNGTLKIGSQKDDDAITFSKLEQDKQEKYTELWQIVDGASNLELIKKGHKTAKSTELTKIPYGSTFRIPGIPPSHNELKRITALLHLYGFSHIDSCMLFRRPRVSTSYRLEFKPFTFSSSG